MSLLKHLLISIAITIFIAWRFPETNLQIAIQNGLTSLIFGLIISTQLLLWTYVFSTSFKNWYKNFIHEKQAQPYEFLSNQFISHLFLFCTTGISWLFVPKYANAIQPLLVYYFCVLIIILVLIYICIWIEDEIL
jgi:hypothetical protein